MAPAICLESTGRVSDVSHHVLYSGVMVLAAHRIRLRPTQAQIDFFKRNCGFARYAYNWALVRWNAQYECRRKQISWLCEEHGVQMFVEKQGKQRRLPEKQLLQALAACGVTDPILPPAPYWQGLSSEWTRYKRVQALDWADELLADAALQAVKNLGTAFKNFYQRLKEGKSGRASGFPKRKKKGIHDSYVTVARKGETSFSVEGQRKSIIQGKRIRLPKVGWVRMAEPLRFSGQIKQVTISRRADQWFASVLVEVQSKVSGSNKRKEEKWNQPADQYRPLSETQAAVGVDLGLKHAFVLSDGTAIDAPRPLGRMLKRLRRDQRRLSRMRTVALGKVRSKHDPVRQEAAAKKRERKQQKYWTKLAIRKGLTVDKIAELHEHANTSKQRARGGAVQPRGRCRLFEAKNYQKQKTRVARLHSKVASRRESWLHNATTQLIRSYGLICIEDLAVRGMMANAKLSRAIADVGMFEFRRQLEYKQHFYDRKVIAVDRFFPSSKRCSECEWVYQELKLSERDWKCGRCGTRHDRDVNAARNLLWKGTEMYSETLPALPEKKPAETGVRRSQTGSVSSSRSRKQESSRRSSEQV